MAIKAIIFDKDGTLIDFNATWGRSAVEAFTEMADGNHTLFNRLAEVSGLDVASATFSHPSPFLGDSAEELAVLWGGVMGRQTDEPFLREIDSLFSRASLQYLTGFAWTGRVLCGLRERGLRLAVGTNDSEATARLHMRQLGWETHFDAVLGYDSGCGPKPGPGMVLAFRDQAECSANEIVMVGDSVHDLEAGKAAGALAVGVRSGPAGEAGLGSMADAIIDDISELEALISTPPFATG